MKTQTENSTKHTPIPWRVWPRLDNRGPFEIGPDISDTDPVGALIVSTYEQHETEAVQEANAEFICQAVNQHDQLTAQRDALRSATQGMVDAYGNCECVDGEPTGHCPWCIARAALALCEPKDKEGGMV